MSSTTRIDLYELLPVLYRLRDEQLGQPLQALLEIIAGQANILKADIDGLWDDLFIETCADWVIPYIGDLVGNIPLHEVAQRRRADVAKTIYYRRRKGTLPMLEELARDVTGWGAHTVAFFELLGWTQNLNHQRYRMAPNPRRRDPNATNRVGTVNLRDLDSLDRLHGPFDSVSHVVDVRGLDQAEGWYGIRKVGFFLWRLRRYPLTGVPARRADAPHAYGYHFSPLGNPAPLFNAPQRETDEAGLASEVNVVSPIRPTAFYFDLHAYQDRFAGTPPAAQPPTTYYGPGRAFSISKDGVPVAPMEIMCKDLRDWDRPPAGKVAVDLCLGRLAFAPGEEPGRGVEVTYNYGFGADLGGGPYVRLATLARPDPALWWVSVTRGGPIATLQQAITAWTNAGRPDAVIEIADNGVYGGAVAIEPADGRSLVIQARDGFRPTLRLLGNLRVTGAHPDAALTLNGMLVEGGVDIEGSLGELSIIHCTLVPGRALREDGGPAQVNGVSLSAAAPNERLRVTIAASIVGALRLPSEMRDLTIRDAIVDAFGGAALARPGTTDQPGPATTLERATIFGSVHITELTLASEVIFTGRVAAQRRQAGCVRFSYVPPESETPRRYRCQPDLALAARAAGLGLASVSDLPPSEVSLLLARLRPSFTSIHYGQPTYAQLAVSCPEEMRTGAEDGSEMGVFCSLKQPQREANLRIRLEEYLPFGLEAAPIYATRAGGDCHAR